MLSYTNMDEGIVELDSEQSWMRVAATREALKDSIKAIDAYESALEHNPCNTMALLRVAKLNHCLQNYDKAATYYRRFLVLVPSNGNVYVALGHCCLMLDELAEANVAYQGALGCLKNQNQPNLWYGMGVLYHRCGYLQHAECAFTAVLSMNMDFPKRFELYFRLGIIYKQRGDFELSLRCLLSILKTPPSPLDAGDVWFQIGHVYEQQKAYDKAVEAYENVLSERPKHSKVLQQLGWMYHNLFTLGVEALHGKSPEDCCKKSFSCLFESIEADHFDSYSWYLLGRCYMDIGKYDSAHETYQQALYRDQCNPVFWSSIGVLYFQISLLLVEANEQHRKQYRLLSLDAFWRAIRLNPFLSNVWFDMGVLYENCGQFSDSIHSYQRAKELDPENITILRHLSALQDSVTTEHEHIISPPPPPIKDIVAPVVTVPSALAAPAGTVGIGIASLKDAVVTAAASENIDRIITSTYCENNSARPPNKDLAIEQIPGDDVQASAHSRELTSATHDSNNINRPELIDDDTLSTIPENLQASPDRVARISVYEKKKRATSDVLILPGNQLPRTLLPLIKTHTSFVTSQVHGPIQPFTCNPPILRGVSLHGVLSLKYTFGGGNLEYKQHAAACTGDPETRDLSRKKGNT